MTAFFKSDKPLATILRLGFVLLVIAAAVALVLGLVNLLTAGRIADIQAETMQAAMQEVLPAASYTEVADLSGNEAVDAIWQADTGWVVQTTVSGSQGNITLMIGVDKTYTCTGISITQHSETAGLGAIAGQAGEKGEAFRAQFIGQSGTVAVTKNGGQIDAISGATITSNAVCNAVTIALAACQAQSGTAAPAPAAAQQAPSGEAAAPAPAVQAPSAEPATASVG